MQWKLRNQPGDEKLYKRAIQNKTIHQPHLHIRRNTHELHSNYYLRQPDDHRRGGKERQEMRVTTSRSANLAYMDYLWRQFVATDPDLARLERSKQKIAHRHAWEQNIRQKHSERLRARREKIARAAAMVIIALLTVAGLLAMLVMA